MKKGMMKYKSIAMLLAVAAALASTAEAYAQKYNSLPVDWKWTQGGECIFSYDGSFADGEAFAWNPRKAVRTDGVKAPEKFADFPIRPEAAVNMTFSPDSSAIAFTRNNDLYVVDIASGLETRLTFDGTDLILNGYASWVYYEEIFGRQSRYRAFWWAPDSRHIAYYRFDNSEVTLFPIFSPFGTAGTLNNTRYPKAGEANPKVRIAIADLESGKTVIADFDEDEDQYFGTPFWGPDSREFFVPRMPRLQQDLDLYAVSVDDGSRKHIYHEHYPTWLDWISDVIFTSEGLYMSRCFETGWQQIYFLSYDGSQFRRLSDGPNWDIALVSVDESKGDIYFTARRDATVRRTFYKLDRKGRITALTDPAFYASNIKMSPDGKYFTAMYSNSSTPTKVAVFDMAAVCSKNAQKAAAARLGTVVADYAGPDFDASAYALPEIVTMTTDDGYVLPAMVTWPVNMDPSKKYPVHFEVYGGPDTPYVRDYWRTPNAENQWWSKNGIIHIVCDPRSAGHCGKAGEDMAYRQISVVEVEDYKAWAAWMASKDCVDASRMGVEGFSFGGTSTVMLLAKAPECFCCGIAGGGVYDFRLYDTHYTERFMDTPQNNPDGYDLACCLKYVKDIDDSRVTLRLTHGTGDDNVHFQNTLLLVDELQKQGKHFELMIYPDGMHGYRGYQHSHDVSDAHDFWLRNLKR